MSDAKNKANLMEMNYLKVFSGMRWRKEVVNEKNSVKRQKLQTLNIYTTDKDRTGG